MRGDENNRKMCFKRNSPERDVTKKWRLKAVNPLKIVKNEPSFAFRRSNLHLIFFWVVADT